jgi:hypothetical protein
MEDMNEGTYKWEGNLLILSCGCKMEFDSNSFDLVESDYCKFHTKTKFRGNDVF